MIQVEGIRLHGMRPVLEEGMNPNTGIVSDKDRIKAQEFARTIADYLKTEGMDEQYSDAFLTLVQEEIEDYNPRYSLEE